MSPRVLAAGAALATLVVPATAAAQPTPKQVAAAVKVPAMMKHLAALQGIAEANGGNRAAGTPGYTASRDYVVAQLKASGYRPEVQEFTFTRWTELAPPVLERTAPTPAALAVKTVSYSGAGDVTAAAVAVDVHLDGDRASTSGCEAADFAGFPAGAVAVLQRGTCTIGEKIDFALAAGAAGVVVFNQGDTPDREGEFEVTAGDPKTIPAVTTTFAAGAELAAGGATVHLAVSTQTDVVPTWNVVAQTPGTGPALTVGAHLDSVPAGPGINDDGSGTAFLLELARQVHRLGLRPAAPLRFGFWAAEEEGLYGSAHYVEALGDGAQAAVSGYLNFDMLGSPNGLRLIYKPIESTPPGSANIEGAFYSWFRANHLTAEATPIDDRSDYASFADVGIPVGGLFSGAEELKTEAQWRETGGIVGVLTDPNYHTANDRLSNINTKLYGQLTRAGAHVAVRLALDPALLTRP